MRHFKENELRRHLETRDQEVAEHLELCEQCRLSMREVRRLLLHEQFLTVADRAASERVAAAALLPAVLYDPLHFQTDCATLGLVQALIPEVERALGRDPSFGLDLTTAALGFLEALDPAAYPHVRWLHAVGTVWKYRSTAFRLLSRYEDALVALDTASASYADLPDSDFQNATVDFSRAMILRELDRLDEAGRLVDSAADVFERYGDRRRLIHAKLVKGAIAFRQGNFRNAWAIFDALIPTVEQENDIETLARIYNNLAQCHAEAGELPTAADQLIRAIRLFDEAGLDVEKRRTTWVLAQLLVKRGEFDAAAAHFRRLAEEFASVGMIEEAALCRLDLTEALLVLGRMAEAEQAARRAVEEFSEVHLNHRASTALGYLREAIAAGKATRETVSRARSYLASLGLRAHLFAG